MITPCGRVFPGRHRDNEQHGDDADIFLYHFHRFAICPRKKAHEFPKGFGIILFRLRRPNQNSPFRSHFLEDETTSDGKYWQPGFYVLLDSIDSTQKKSFLPCDKGEKVPDFFCSLSFILLARSTNQWSSLFLGSAITAWSLYYYWRKRDTHPFLLFLRLWIFPVVLFLCCGTIKSSQGLRSLLPRACLTASCYKSITEIRHSVHHHDQSKR